MHDDPSQQLTNQNGAGNFAYGGQPAGVTQRKHARANAGAKRVGHIIGADAKCKNKGYHEAHHHNP